MSTERPPRPGVLRWLRYAYGGTLPDRYLDWMFADATARTWRLRQIARSLVPTVPLFIVLAVLLPVLTPAPLWTVLAVLGIGLLGSGYFAAGLAAENVEVRLVRNGFAPEAARRRRADVFTKNARGTPR